MISFIFNTHFVFVYFSYLLLPPGVFKSLMADKNWMQETKRQQRLSERVRVLRVTEKLETRTYSLTVMGETLEDDTPEEVLRILAFSSSEANDTVGVDLWRKTSARKAISIDKRHIRARE